MSTLVIGGTSGLGLELAKEFSVSGNPVLVTGRHDPKVEGIEYRKLDLNHPDLPTQLGNLTLQLSEIKTLVYAAGYFQEGRITDLANQEIEEMLNVGARGLMYAVKAILENQEKLSELITITSTSQWTPRQYEPVYNYVKAGGAHFSNAMAEDGRIDKVIVAGPAGMKTDFWDGVERHDLDTMLDPKWVAERIMEARKGDYQYKEIRILRQPPRVEEVSER